ncbi:hypothetical protein [Ammoniphilus resinae]|uniref:Uncharacterized protein n=1 Tax=Ammoniphilus resinae TaxID=861532 RepID=A0ABS4GP49_9BACL|nr:hypothetical protein [Ammoniphilus resinae]MBP1932036.1 hypothetical protein [Ammoniphilus resinae]
MHISRELTENYSIYKGLNELQIHFLQEELKKDHRRSQLTLRRIAKKRAIGQRIKWMFEETLIMFSIVGFFAACVLSIVVWNL